MSYFNYHGKLQQKLKTEKVERIEIVDKWNDISPAMVIYFVDGSVFPIREHHWEEYYKILNNNN